MQRPHPEADCSGKIEGDDKEIVETKNLTASLPQRTRSPWRKNLRSSYKPRKQKLRTLCVLCGELMMDQDAEFKTVGKKAASKLFYYASIALALVLAGVTIIGVFVGHVPPESSTLISFIGLLLSGLSLVSLITAIYQGIRRRFWTVIPLIAIAANWQYLGRILQPSFPVEEENGRTLKIAMYNIDSFGNEQPGYSCKEIAKYMGEHQVDIVRLQESAASRYFTADSIRNTLANWQCVIIPQAPDNISILQTALLSEYPVKDSKLITYLDSRNCSMWCDLDIDGQTTRVLNDYLQTAEVSQSRRRLERGLIKSELIGRKGTVIRQLLEGLNENFRRRAAQAKTLERLIRITPYPILVCGDFNSLPSSYIHDVVKDDNLQDLSPIRISEPMRPAAT